MVAPFASELLTWHSGYGTREKSRLPTSTATSGAQLQGIDRFSAATTYDATALKLSQTMVLANVVAARPGRSAAHTSTAQVLRGE
jgi:hypothetical protein